MVSATCTILRAVVAMSGLGLSSSKRRAKAPADFISLSLYAIVIADRSESSVCAGDRLQCVKYAASSILRLLSVTLPLASSSRSAVRYSVQIESSSLSSPTCCRLSATVRVAE